MQLFKVYISIRMDINEVISNPVLLAQTVTKAPWGEGGNIGK